MRRAACLLAFVALVAACSSTDDDDAAPATAGAAEGAESTAPPDTASATTTSPTGNTGEASSGVTASEIRIGGVYTESQFPGVRAAVQARIDRENAAGGINGREIVLVDMIDDGGDPTASNDAVRRLVEQEDVFAVGPIVTNAFNAGGYLAEQQVPFFGWGISVDWCHNDFGFSLIGCIDATQSTTLANWTSVWAEAAGADSLEGKTLAVIADDSDSGRATLKQFKYIVEADGGSVVYSEANLTPPPGVIGDYTPFATDILSSADGGPPDLVDVLASPTNLIGLATKLQELGYEGTILNPAMYDPQAVGVAALMTTILVSAPFEQTDIPAMQQTIEDLDSASPPVPHTLGALNAYWATEHLIQVLHGVGPDLSQDAFVTTLNGGFTFDGQGVFADLTYPAAHTEGIPSCASAVTSDGTSYSVAVPFTCDESLDNPFVDN